MIPLTINVKDRGSVPRRFGKVHTHASRRSWRAAAWNFHEHRRDLRFSAEHGKAAGYSPRKGEQAGLSGKDFWRSYTGKKMRIYGHRRPLEFTGETRKAVRTATITFTSKSARVKYPGAAKLNFRHPKSQVRAADEFRRLIPSDASSMAHAYDQTYDREFRTDTVTETRSI